MVYSNEDHVLHIAILDDGIKVKFNLHNQARPVKNGKVIEFQMLDPHKPPTAVGPPVPVVKPKRKPRQPKAKLQPVGLGGWLRGWLGNLWGRGLTPTTT